ncbi:MULTISPECIES: nucleoid-associated protein [Halomonas]|uniref:nucleoid-associated protein n=1 Tax=Halomonas TaxID=2745 RepID=UPI001C98C6D0|nr:MULTISPECIES: nucleoid-associated protein [Halomonas]MBY6209714.1 nucleoid-associated protein [Halomonas sp. DP3Y7-2]MBY6229933.1 nucleoid-associated protein [Halomonas sp. DP3Y7-1]MCA0918252.1 nucleoid-associated protein [Halomonas denitrificans]
MLEDAYCEADVELVGFLQHQAFKKARLAQSFVLDKEVSEFIARRKVQRQIEQFFSCQGFSSKKKTVGKIMQLVNLIIDRIIIHQVYQRDPDGNKVEPLQSHEYTRFDDNAMEEFKKRVRDALGDGSKAVQMQIVNQGDGDLPRIVDSIISQEDDTFSVSSYDIARKLTDSQQRKNIPGGILVIFTGKYGHPQKRFLGIIKAEIHSAYEKKENPTTKEISLKFVEEVLLTPGTRLYKTAALFEKENYSDQNDDLNDNWSVMVSDYQISQADGKAAAQYFYSDFLGFGYPATSARTTKMFYEKTREFIDSLGISPENRNDLYNALTTYLKVDNSSTINPGDFASNYFDIDTQDAFNAHMEESGIPTTSFTKDIAHIESNLKYRKVNFSKNVKITAPSAIFKNYVMIEEIDGEPDETGTAQAWTKVIIKDRITKQE